MTVKAETNKVGMSAVAFSMCSLMTIIVNSHAFVKSDEGARYGKRSKGRRSTE